MAKEASTITYLVGVYIILLLIAVSTAAGENTAKDAALEFKHQNLIKEEEQCDIFFGEWIYDPSLELPYTEQCEIITWRRFLSCRENGRHDDTYLHWRWKPYGCDLPSFDPEKFLNAARNKSFGGIGDSLMGNHLQSLLCLLSKVEKPTVLTAHLKWHFPSYNFTVEFVSSELLLKANSREGPSIIVHLDVLDDTWTARYHEFDYVLIGDGAWFDKQMILVENDTVVGCHGCQQKSLPDCEKYYPFRKAIDLTLRFMTAASDHDRKPEVVVFRSQSPNHFEHGHWDEGGFCNRTLPFNGIGDIPDELTNYEDDKLMQAIVKEEFAKAVATRSKNMTRLQLLDIYYLSLLRPDGHPNGYRKAGSNDCLHWCLPGVTDTWNDLLMAMLWTNEDMKTSHYY